MFFFINDDELLKKYTDVWNKVSNSIKKEFFNEPICNKNFLKTKIKFYPDEASGFLIKK